MVPMEADLCRFGGILRKVVPKKYPNGLGSADDGGEVLSPREMHIIKVSSLGSKWQFVL